MPDGVTQEAYGYLCVHYAIRWLMHTVAQEARADPDRLSFTRTLRVARRTAASHPGFSPEVLDDAQPRRRPSCSSSSAETPPCAIPAVVKRKMSNYGVTGPSTAANLHLPSPRSGS